MLSDVERPLKIRGLLVLQEIYELSLKRLVVPSLNKVGAVANPLWARLIGSAISAPVVLLGRLYRIGAYSVPEY